MRPYALNTNILPENEPNRLKKLYEYQILDSGVEGEASAETEGTFRHVVSLATHLFNMPIALVSFVDRERVWFKAGVGLDGLKEVERDISLCSLAIMSEEPTVFSDTLEEPCLLANPLVAGELGFRFYAAAPLKTIDGYNLGSVCVIDRVPREFSEDNQLTLQYLAKLVMDELELWKFKVSSQK
ncbi:GAF domain-containing protein [Rufibacter roseus]|uniref:GAF domain-containing protein n=1 Tax=Rufibacter roseus TaxID=1567108 RepID=A0ABW2DMD4_9BACT|nr:GAF domain-containing protein [Rufibacter roseus]